MSMHFIIFINGGQYPLPQIVRDSFEDVKYANLR